MKDLKIKDYLSTTDGIMKWIMGVWDGPWTSSYENSIYLDMLYMSRSGKKPAGALLTENIADPSNITREEKNNIAAAIVAMNRKSWERSYEAINALYDLLNTYKTTTTKDSKDTTNELTTGESTNDTTTGGKDGRVSVITESGTESRTIGEEESTTGTNTESGTSQRNIYAYNTTSADGVPESKTTETKRDTKDDTTTRDTSDDLNTTLSRGDNVTTTYGRTVKETYSNTKTHEGDITGHSKTTQEGYTTRPQEQIEHELVISEYKYFKAVFEDIDKLITLSVY